MTKDSLVKLPTLAIFVAFLSFLTLACGSAGPTLAPIPTATPTPVPEATATPEPAATDTPAPPLSESAIRLRTVIVKLDSSGTPSSLEDGDRMVSREDHYGLYFNPAQDAFIYAVQQDSTGHIDVLFPNPAFSDQANPVPAGQEVWVPKDINYWFFLDDSVGRERIYVVAARERIPELETLLSGAGTTGGAGQLVTWLTAAERGVGGVTKTATPVVLPDDRSIDLDTLVLAAEGDTFVYRVEFDHVGMPR